jgi:hypothetical protein
MKRFTPGSRSEVADDASHSTVNVLYHPPIGPVCETTTIRPGQLRDVAAVCPTCSYEMSDVPRGVSREATLIR